VSRRTPAEAEAAFRDAIEALGATVIGRYVRVGLPVEVRCAAGHVSNCTPNNVLRGGGICLRCLADRKYQAQRAEFVRTVEAADWTVLDVIAPDANAYARVECPAGHEQLMRRDPLSLICRTCTPARPKNLRARYTF
jgi:hypothetical protein